jgi:hypothetical protein
VTRAHSSALHPGRAGVCQARQQPLWRRHEAPARRPPLGQVRPVLGSAPAAVPGPWVGARQWPFLGSVPPSPPPGASTAAPPTGNGTLVPRPQVDCKGDGWWEKIALWARVMPSIRRKGRTRCGPHRRDSRRTRRSKQLRRRPQVAGRPLQALCSRKKAVMTCGNNRSFFPSAAFLNCQT